MRCRWLTYLAAVAAALSLSAAGPAWSAQQSGDQTGSSSSQSDDSSTAEEPVEIDADESEDDAETFEDRSSTSQTTQGTNRSQADRARDSQRRASSSRQGTSRDRTGASVRAELDAEAEGEATFDDRSQTQSRSAQQPRSRDATRSRSDLQGRAQEDRSSFQRDKRTQQDARRFQDSERMQDRDRFQAEGEFRSGRFEAQRGSVRMEDRLGLAFSAAAQNELVVSRIVTDSVASQIGLRRGDVILSIDGRRVLTPTEFYRVIDLAGPDDRVEMVVIRDGRRDILYVDTADLVAVERYDAPRRDVYQERDAYARQRGTAWLGVFLDERYRQAVVESVEPGSPADRAGLEQGDWILAINGRSVQSADHLSALVRQMRPGQEIDIRISRRQDDIVSTRLGSRPEIPASYEQRRYGAAEPGYYEESYGSYEEEVDGRFEGYYDAPLDQRYDARDDRFDRPREYQPDVEFGAQGGARVDSENRPLDRNRGLLDRIRDRRD